MIILGLYQTFFLLVPKNSEPMGLSQEEKESCQTACRPTLQAKDELRWLREGLKRFVRWGIRGKLGKVSLEFALVS